MRDYAEQPLTLPEAIARLQELAPEGFRVVYNELANRTVYSLRIATPFAMPNNERIYAYLEMNDSTQGFLRMHDDGVLKDWLEHADLYWCLVRNRKAVEEQALKPNGTHFTRSSRLSPQVSIRVSIEEVFDKITSFADAMYAAAKLTQDMRHAERVRTSPDISIPIPDLMGALLGV
jgi:hypothetical protein